MEETVKVSNVLGDETRFQIYQFIVKSHEEVSVNQMAKQCSIHPNVARTHLQKLEGINLIQSYTPKNGKGGRPKRLYKLSDKLIELSFPYRDYKLLASVAIESFANLGELGKQALYDTGRKYGMKTINHYCSTNIYSIEQKLHVLEEASTMLGMYPAFTYDAENHTITLKINNCPFKEIATLNHAIVCEMHYAFLKGMFESLFTDITLSEEENMFNGCINCTYVAKFMNV